MRNNTTTEQQLDKLRKIAPRWSFALIIASNALMSAAYSRPSHSHFPAQLWFIALDVLLWVGFLIVYYRQVWRLEAQAKREMKARFEAEDARLFGVKRPA